MKHFLPNGAFKIDKRYNLFITNMMSLMSDDFSIVLLQSIALWAYTFGAHISSVIDFMFEYIIFYSIVHFSN